MNIIEYNLLLLSLLSLFAYLFYVDNRKDFKYSIITLVLIAPILIFSISKSTSFLTVDETYIILEPIDIKNSNMIWWNKMAVWRIGSLRTTEIIIGPIFSILNAFIDFSKYNHLNKMIAKAMHWYIGFLLILYIHYLLNNKYLNPLNSKANTVLIICMFLLLPVNNFTLRIFNFDLFSMLFATIALILLLIAIHNNSQKEMTFSIIFALFAAQEKLNVSPILTLSIFFFTYCIYKNSKIYHLKSIKRMPKLFVITAIGFGIPLLLSLLSYLIIGLCRGGDIPPIEGLADPIIGWAYPFMPKFTAYYSIGKVVSGFHYGLNISKGKINLIFVLIIYFGVMICVEITRCLSLLKNKKVNAYKDSVKKILREYQSGFIIFIFVLVFIIGAIGIYSSEYLIGPIIELSAGNYKPPAFGGWYLHFDTPNILLHYLKYITYTFSIFCNGLPSILILILIYSLLKIKQQKNYIVLFLGVGAVLLPFFYSITLIQVNMRYINLSFVLFLICTIYAFDKVELDKKLRWGLTLLIVTFVFIEVYPFYPINGSFRPIWVKYPRPFIDKPSIGKMRPGAWGGWGEELMIAGKKIEKKCIEQKIDCKDIRIYYSYPGAWLDAQIPIQTFHMQKNILSYRFTKNDYYVINRASVSWGYIRDINFEKIKPDFKIDYRGYTQAWIIRGDNLIKTGTGSMKLLFNTKDNKAEIRDRRTEEIYFSIPFIN